MTSEIHELNLTELNAASGGMKYTPGTKNDNVIDARGGQVKILWFTITKDINGKVSSLT